MQFFICISSWGFSLFLFFVFVSSCSFSFFRVSGFCVGLAGLSLATHDVLSSPCTVMKPHRGSPARDPRVPHITRETRKTRETQEQQKKTKKNEKRKSPLRNKHKHGSFFQNKVKCFFSVRQFGAKPSKHTLHYISLHMNVGSTTTHSKTWNSHPKPPMLNAPLPLMNP